MHGERLKKKNLSPLFHKCIKPICNSITSGLNFYISGSFLFKTGASPRCSKLQDTSLLYILTTLLFGSMHFLSVYFYYFFSPSCTSFYALCSSVVSCLLKSSFSNKFHKTWFRVRKDLECIVLKQGTVIWAHTVGSFCHIMTLIFNTLSPWPQSSFCCQSSITNTKNFNPYPANVEKMVSSS